MTVEVLQLPYRQESLQGFSSLRPLKNAFLLDSGNGYDDHIDVYAAKPHTIEQLNTADDIEFHQILKRITTSLKQCQFNPDQQDYLTGPLPGWFGVWSYDLAAITECIRFNSPPGHPLPLLWMGFYPAIIVTNHVRKTTQLLYLNGFESHRDTLRKAMHTTPAPLESDFTLTSRFSSDMTEAEYQQKFEKIQAYIRAGDSYQINLALRFSAPFAGSTWDAYQILRQTVSAPMGCYFETPEWALLSMSPERFIAHHNGIVVSKPIKGTRPRSADARQDRLNADELRNSGKDRAENLMIVDLLRNDLGRTMETGSVKVEKLFDIESFSNVHHLVSTISGRLKQDVAVLDMVAAAFPGGSITGAPKRRAMEIIEELEPVRRGFYCGSALYLDVSGRLDSNILIRSLVASQHTLHCWGGGGLVADSTCEQEYQEIHDKVGNLLRILSQPIGI